MDEKEFMARLDDDIGTTDQIAFLKRRMEEIVIFLQEDHPGEKVKEDQQGEVEEDEKTEEKSDSAAEEKSDKDGRGEEQGEESDCEDNVDYEPNETTHDLDRVIPVEPGLENSEESLDFNTWKKMLEDAAPKSKSVGKLKRAKANDPTADDVKVKKARVETPGVVPNPQLVEAGVALFPFLSELWESKKSVEKSRKLAEEAEKDLNNIIQKVQFYYHEI